AETGHLGGVFRNIKTHPHMRLGAEVVDFVGLHLTENGIERARIVQVAIEESEPRALFMGILIEMVNAIRIEGRRAADDTVNIVTFFQQQLSQKRTILTSYPGNQSCLGHV